MEDDRGEKGLVKKAQLGNKVAFDALVIKYQNKILHLMYRYIKDPNDAMDVVQEVFIKAYKALPNFRGDSSFYTWIYRIAINTAKNYISHVGRRPPSIDIDIDTAELRPDESRLKEYETPENYLISDEAEAVVLKAVDSLPKDIRMAIILREIEGLSYAQIAKLMQCPIGTVRSRIFRARELIGLKLNEMIK